MRRVSIGLAVVLLAACETKAPSQAPTTAPSPTSMQSSTATVHPTSSPTAVATPIASSAPRSIALPAGFDRIPWATMPVTGDEDVFTVSIGVLGQPASTSRTYGSQPWVLADEGAIIIAGPDQTEIIDAVTGEAIASFDPTSLELDKAPPDNLSYYFARRLEVDVARGYLYFLSANRDGVKLRRFDLSGHHERLLANVAPDPGKDSWDSDFTLTASGGVVATACPTDRTKVTDFRCRLFTADSGENGPIRPRLLSLQAARPCAVLAASDRWLIANSTAGCTADGGPPLFSSYMSLDLRTLKTTVVTAPSEIQPLGMSGDDSEPVLVANSSIGDPYVTPYRSVGVLLRASDAFYPVQRIVTEDEGPVPGAFAGYVWSVAGRGIDWTLLHGFGPEYAGCQVRQPAGDTETCPSGPALLQTSAGTLELPPGTYGEFVPPFGFAGL